MSEICDTLGGMLFCFSVVGRSFDHYLVHLSLTCGEAGWGRTYIIHSIVAEGSFQNTWAVDIRD